MPPIEGPAVDFMFWIILLVVIAGAVWWWRKRKNLSAASGGTQPEQSDRPVDGNRHGDSHAGGGIAAPAEAGESTGTASVAATGTSAEAAAPAPRTAPAPAEQALAEPAAPATSSAPVPAEPALAEPAAPATSTEPVPAEALESTPAASRDHSRARATAVGTGAGEEGAKATAQNERRTQDEAEWDTHWSEGSGSTPAGPGAGHLAGAASAPQAQAQAQTDGASFATAAEGTPSPSMHRPGNTEPHTPTLPGAETAALEDVDDAGTALSAPVPFGSAPDSEGLETPAGTHMPRSAGTTETQDRTLSSALVETGANHAQDTSVGTASGAQERTGHLAADEPYGAGSASAGADGTGPADYTVKGDAAGMVYYEEGNPEYGQTRADVWFESAAHAEAAGFRAPRRRRIQ